MSRALKAAKMGPRGFNPRLGRSAYRGDPGLFGAIGGAIKGGISGLFRGGPVGAITGAAAGAATGWKGQPPAAQPSMVAGVIPPPQMGTVGQIPPGTQVIPKPGVVGTIERILPGGESGYVAQGPPPRGYHLNKTGYFLKDGSYVAKGTRYVRDRRRNPLNPRALDRAMGRLTSAKKAASKIGRITIRKKNCA